MASRSSSTNTASGTTTASKDNSATCAQSSSTEHHDHERRNARWPVAEELPGVQTLAGKFKRRVVLGGIYFFWVCGLGGCVGMWVRTFLAVAYAVATRDAASIPPSVVVFVACMAAYESYRLVVPPAPWPALRQFVRKALTHYPYFRFNTCVFEKDLLAHSAATDDSTTTANNDLSYNFEPALPPADKSLYAFHPHGVLTCGMALNGAHHDRFALTNARWLVAENLFWFPVLRDLLTWLEFNDVRKQTFTQLMARGQNIGFVPGGFEDATLYKRGAHRTFLRQRYGFIKLALQYGYKIYPIYTFGEEQTYHAFAPLLPLRLWLNSLKIPAALFAGSSWCPFMPRSQVDLISVVGTPLELPQIADPTPADVQTYHALYVTKLQQLFDTHKKAYATNPNATLELY